MLFELPINLSADCLPFVSTTAERVEVVLKPFKYSRMPEWISLKSNKGEKKLNARRRKRWTAYLIESFTSFIPLQPHTHSTTRKKTTLNQKFPARFSFYLLDFFFWLKFIKFSCAARTAESGAVENFVFNEISRKKIISRKCGCKWTTRELSGVSQWWGWGEAFVIWK